MAIKYSPNGSYGMSYQDAVTAYNHYYGKSDPKDIAQADQAKRIIDLYNFAVSNGYKPKSEVSNFERFHGQIYEGWITDWLKSQNLLNEAEAQAGILNQAKQKGFTADWGNDPSGTELEKASRFLDFYDGIAETAKQAGFSITPTTTVQDITNWVNSGNNRDSFNRIAEETNVNHELDFQRQDQETAIAKELEKFGPSSQLNKVISGNFLSGIQNDPKQIAMYIQAIAYGGYTGMDVVKDIKRLELASQGNEEAKNLQIISPTMSRDAYYATEEGKAALSSSEAIMPEINSGTFADSVFLDYGLAMPDELFKTLVPILDRDSQEFKDAVEDIKSVFFDMATAQLQATNEQEKAVADTNYANFKEQLERQYGIALSDDATKAWEQIENLQDTFSKANLTGSGLEMEQIDKSLRNTRKQDQRLRQEKLTKAEQEKAAYYTSSASAAEIAALTPEEREKYGLAPSREIRSMLNLTNLRRQYPDASVEELQRYRDSILDENGNYRSSIYSKYYSGVQSNKAAQKASAETEVIERAADAEAKLYSNFDRTDPYSSPTRKETAELRTIANDDSDGETLDDYKGANTSQTPSPYQETQPKIEVPSFTSQSTQTQTPSYSNLYDYYTKTAGSYNTWNSPTRMTDAKAAGITNYTGTSEQNDSLLKYLTTKK